MREKFVLVSQGTEPAANSALVFAVERYGSLKIMDKTQAMRYLAGRDQAIVILDATEVTDWESWLSCALAARPGLPIIVARTIPDWRAERKAIIELGAIGNIIKTENRQRLSSMLGRILDDLGSSPTRR